MFEHLRWKAFLRVSNPKNAATLIRRIGKAIDSEVFVHDVKPYRKDRTLFEASFTTLLNIETVENALFESLRLAGKLSHTWEMRLPQEYQGGKWDFGASSSRRMRISGIVNLEFETANYS